LAITKPLKKTTGNSQAYQLCSTSESIQTEIWDIVNETNTYFREAKGKS